MGFGNRVTRLAIFCRISRRKQHYVCTVYLHTCSIYIQYTHEENKRGKKRTCSAPRESSRAFHNMLGSIGAGRQTQGLTRSGRAYLHSISEPKGSASATTCGHKIFMTMFREGGGGGASYGLTHGFLDNKRASRYDDSRAARAHDKTLINLESRGSQHSNHAALSSPRTLYSVKTPQLNANCHLSRSKIKGGGA